MGSRNWVEAGSEGQELGAGPECGCRSCMVEVGRRGGVVPEGVLVDE